MYQWDRALQKFKKTKNKLIIVQHLNRENTYCKKTARPLLIGSRCKSKKPICNICAAYWALRTSKWARFTHCKSKQDGVSIRTKIWKFKGIANFDFWEDLQQKCRHGRRIAAVGDSKHTLQTWELASPFPMYLSSFSFISCMRAWNHKCSSETVSYKFRNKYQRK